MVCFQTGGSHAVFNSKCPGMSCENSYSDNAGLQFAVDALAPVLAAHSNKNVSVADFWVLAGITAIDFSLVPVAQRATSSPPSTMFIPWMTGRNDLPANASSPSSRLPDAETGYETISDLFLSAGLTTTDMTALIGAHTLGRLNGANSGYTGPWEAASPFVFDNQYYNSLINRKWTFTRPNNAKPGATGQVSLWKDFAPAPETTSMLNADMALVTTFAATSPINAVFVKNSPQFPKSPTFDLVDSYANNNTLWIANFKTAFAKLTSLGHTCLSPVGRDNCVRPTPSAIPSATVNGTASITAKGSALVAVTLSALLASLV